MKIRIDEAIEVQNLRQMKKNHKKGKPAHVGCITKANLGRLIWGNNRNSLVYMSQLATGKRQSIKPDWIDLICKECGVDPNFLFGFDSIHDKGELKERAK